MDSQGISFFKLINIYGRSVADVHKKASSLLVREDRVAFMVHVIGQLSDFLELLPLEPGGPELHRIASKLEER